LIAHRAAVAEDTERGVNEQGALIVERDLLCSLVGKPDVAGLRPRRHAKLVLDRSRPAAEREVDSRPEILVDDRRAVVNVPDMD